MLPFSIQCLIVGILGLVISTAMVLKSLSTKARLANVEFSSKKALTDDWFTPFIALMAILVALFFLPYTKPEWPKLLILGFFLFLGYTGSDFVSRFFSVANKKINAAIDYKTTVADNLEGNTEERTKTS